MPPAVRVLLLAALLAGARAACASSGDVGVLVYVIGAVRSLARVADELASVFCEDADTWADGLVVAPLLHAWARSSCAGSDNVESNPPKFFAGALVNFTMDDMDARLAQLVSRESPASPEHTRAAAYVSQLFQLYNLNQRAAVLLAKRGRNISADAVVVRWRTDAVASHAAHLRGFLRDCVRLVRDDAAGPNSICILPTPKTKTLSRACLGTQRSRRGELFHIATCCHPEGRGVLSDWVFVTKKRVLDAMDGHTDSPTIYVGVDRTEHRFCETFLQSGARVLIWPATFDVGRADPGLRSVRCETGETPLNKKKWSRAATARRPAVLFNHVPSTGGSTWEVVWSRYACANNLTACPYGQGVSLKTGAGHVSLHCTAHDDVISSHMSTAAFRSLRAAREAAVPQSLYLTVTMVREPCGALLARFLHPQHAHHGVVRAVAAGTPNATRAFETALRTWLAEIARGGRPAKYLFVQSQYLFGARLPSRAAAATALREYDFVGLTERFDASILKVFAMINCAPPAYVLVNSAASKPDASRDPVDRVGELRHALSAGGWYRTTVMTAAARGGAADDFHLYAAAEERFGRTPADEVLSAYRAARTDRTPPPVANAWLEASGYSRPPFSANVSYANDGGWRAYWTWSLPCVRAPRELLRDACDARCADEKVSWGVWGDFVAKAVGRGCGPCAPVGVR